MATASISPPAAAPAGFLSRDRTVAPPGYNRWLVPPAALAIHLSIGEVYAFSVFKLPLHHLLGAGDTAAAAEWSQPLIAGVFSVAIVFLGLSAALFGAWLERAGPRKAMLASALCFGGGLLVSALGVHFHQIALLYLGYGVLGGIGLGLGYISPVSTLIKWFPDRPGLATGLAIMGFGGGAMIGSSLTAALLDHNHTVASTGVAETFATLAAIDLVFIAFGAVIVRVPAAGWRPAGWAAAGRAPEPAGVTAAEAVGTVRFWLLWVVLFVNVTAGIGILEQASPMIQEMFPVGRAGVGGVTEKAAAGFVGLLSLFNMAGRIGWSTLSDALGRTPTYAVFFLLGPVLYATIPESGRAGNVVLFVLVCGVILTMYGGGFATIPAYLRDQFGTLQVGAIHGRLLTAWSAAGVAGPVLVNELRERQSEHGVPEAEVYTLTMDIMAGLLGLGFVCNALILVFGRRAPVAVPASPPAAGTIAVETPATEVRPVLLAAYWLVVLVPLGWGVWQTVRKSLALFA